MAKVDPRTLSQKPTEKQLRQQAEAKAKGGLTGSGISRFEKLSKDTRQEVIEQEEKRLGTRKETTFERQQRLLGILDSRGRFKTESEALEAISLKTGRPITLTKGTVERFRRQYGKEKGFQKALEFSLKGIVSPERTREAVTISSRVDKNRDTSLAGAEGDVFTGVDRPVSRQVGKIKKRDRTVPFKRTESTETRSGLFAGGIADLTEKDIKIPFKPKESTETDSTDFFDEDEAEEIEESFKKPGLAADEPKGKIKKIKEKIIGKIQKGKLGSGLQLSEAQLQSARFFDEQGREKKLTTATGDAMRLATSLYVGAAGVVGAGVGLAKLSVKAPGVVKVIKTALTIDYLRNLPGRIKGVSSAREALLEFAPDVAFMLAGSLVKKTTSFEKNAAKTEVAKYFPGNKQRMPSTKILNNVLKTLKPREAKLLIKNLAKAFSTQAKGRVVAFQSRLNKLYTSAERSNKRLFETLKKKNVIDFEVKKVTIKKPTFIDRFKGKKNYKVHVTFDQLKTLGLDKRVKISQGRQGIAQLIFKGGKLKQIVLNSAKTAKYNEIFFDLTQKGQLKISKQLKLLRKSKILEKAKLGEIKKTKSVTQFKPTKLKKISKVIKKIIKKPDIKLSEKQQIKLVKFKLETIKTQLTKNNKNLVDKSFIEKIKKAPIKDRLKLYEQNKDRIKKLLLKRTKLYDELVNTKKHNKLLIESKSKIKNDYNKLSKNLDQSNKEFLESITGKIKPKVKTIKSKIKTVKVKPKELTKVKDIDIKPEGRKLIKIKEKTDYSILEKNLDQYNREFLASRTDKIDLKKKITKSKIKTVKVKPKELIKIDSRDIEPEWIREIRESKIRIKNDYRILQERLKQELKKRGIKNFKNIKPEELKRIIQANAPERIKKIVKSKGDFSELSKQIDKYNKDFLESRTKKIDIKKRNEMFRESLKESKKITKSKIKAEIIKPEELKKILENRAKINNDYSILEKRLKQGLNKLGVKRIKDVSPEELKKIVKGESPERLKRIIEDQSRRRNDFSELAKDIDRQNKDFLESTIGKSSLKKKIIKSKIKTDDVKDKKIIKSKNGIESRFSGGLSNIEQTTDTIRGEIKPTIDIITFNSIGEIVPISSKDTTTIFLGQKPDIKQLIIPTSSTSKLDTDSEQIKKLKDGTSVIQLSGIKSTPTTKSKLKIDLEQIKKLREGTVIKQSLGEKSSTELAQSISQKIKQQIAQGQAAIQDRIIDLRQSQKTGLKQVQISKQAQRITDLKKIIKINKPFPFAFNNEFEEELEDEIDKLKSKKKYRNFKYRYVPTLAGIDEKATRTVGKFTGFETRGNIITLRPVKVVRHKRRNLKNKLFVRKYHRRKPRR